MANLRQLCVRSTPLLLLALFLIRAQPVSAQPLAPQERLCDPAFHDCRADVLTYIRQETVEIDMGYWMMTDARYSNELVKAWQRGVKIRLLMDPRCVDQHASCVPQNNQLRAAGIPMRNRLPGGILHWKTVIFAGQEQVQFAGANYAPFEFTPEIPYVNYTDELVAFTNDPSLVHSFMRKFDDMWTSTTEFGDFANVTGPLQRSFPTYDIDPELNFPPDESYRPRAIAAYNAENQKIDVQMFRITDALHPDAMIAALGRGVPVRIITDETEYRNPLRLFDAYNVDRMYQAGIPIRFDGHQGIDHEKAVILYGTGMSIFGSSNWTDASNDSQREHNYFTVKPWVSDWLKAQFERKWNNQTGFAETKPFIPLPPDHPSYNAPVNVATNVPVAGATLKWNAGFWAHKYDIYFGTTPNPPLLEANRNLGPSQSSGDFRSYVLPALQPGTTYYWKIVSKTMAFVTADGPVWRFTTAGTAQEPPPPPPPAATVTLVRGPYLQQPTDHSMVVVWATREPGIAELRYATPVGTVSVPAASRLISNADSAFGYDYYQHEASLVGLIPATSYTYQPFVGGIAAAPQASLKTPPAAGSGAISFIAIGDSGTGSPEQRQLADVIARDRFDFVMHVGDIAYGDESGTGDASYLTYQSFLFNVYGWFPAVPFMPVEGNHDSRPSNGNGKAYLDLFSLPRNGASASHPEHAERYYSFDYGPVHFVALDTEFTFQDPARRSEQLAWLAADLAATHQPWKIAFYHRAPYSSGGEHGSDLEVRAAFGPLLEHYGVDLVLTGHEHDYERTNPIRESAIDSDHAVPYVVTGGGGGPLYPASTSTWTAFSASQHEYVKVAADPCNLTLNAIGLDGAVFDTASFSHCGTPPPVNLPPVVTMTSPADGSTTVAPATLTLTAAATDSDGSIVNVDFFAGTTRLGGTSAAPYTLTLPNASTGVYTLRAIATDNSGASTSSAPVTITVTTPPAVLPEGWSNGDVGATGAAGSAAFASGAFTITGAGADVWGTGDAFHYVYRTLVGDGTIVARVSTIQNTANWTKAGVMIRGSLSPSSAQGFMLASWTKGMAFQRRLADGNASVSTPGSTSTAPRWVKLTRTGNSIAAFESADGIAWTAVGSDVFVMGATVDIGLAVSSHVNGVVARATFDNVSVTSAPVDPPPANVAPTVTLTSPANGATATSPAIIGVTAQANDSDGTIARVDFYAGPTKLGTAPTVPYSVTWSGVVAGTYTLTAVAVDNVGTSTPSAPVTITVTDPPPQSNVAPTVTLTSPAAGATASAPATIALTAQAADTDGTIASVDFYAGATKLGTATTAPYAFTWSGVAAGSYTLTAVAIDNGGGAATSGSVTITVTDPPPPSGLPEGWQKTDVGTTGAAGTSTFSNDVFTVTGAGADVWGTADAFQYVYRTLTGNGSIVARVTSVQSVAAWTKAGVMMRSSLSPSSAQGFMLVSWTKGLAFQRRLADGNASVSTSGAAATAPRWVKLTRTANTIAAFESSDGSTWTPVSSGSFVMGPTIDVGLAVSSHVNGVLATAVFDNVVVTADGVGPPPPPPNVAPTVSLTSPSDGSTTQAPATVTLTAAADDGDGTITRVEFFAGTTSLGTATTAPYSVTWSNVAAGTYSLTAVAADNGGGATRSTPVSLTVTVPPPPPSGLLAGWAHSDIGTVPFAGSATLTNDTYTVTGSGVDVWGTADQFHYAYRALTGDGTIVARVASEQNVSTWVKAGVMIRETLAAGAPHAFMLVSPAKGTAFQRRGTAGGISVNTAGPMATAPRWVMLTRVGNTFIAYDSADGVAWTLVGTDTIPMGATVFVGLAVTSHNSGASAKATFDNVTIR